MRTVMELPAGYVPIDEVDLQKDKKLMLLVNGPLSERFLI